MVDLAAKTSLRVLRGWIKLTAPQAAVTAGWAGQQQRCTNGRHYGCGKERRGNPAPRCDESDQYGATVEAKVDEDTGGPGGTTSV